jgi:hypothetical protein
MLCQLSTNKGIFTCGLRGVLLVLALGLGRVATVIILTVSHSPPLLHHLLVCVRGTRVSRFFSLLTTNCSQVGH